MAQKYLKFENRYERWDRKVDSARLTDLHEQGKSIMQISVIMGKSHATVRRWVYSLGLELRRLRIADRPVPEWGRLPKDEERKTPTVAFCACLRDAPRSDAYRMQGL